MPAPLSIFTAAHECEGRIDVPYRSLLAQTDLEWEWVIVDDSPGPDTAAHLERLAASAEGRGRIRCERIDSRDSIGAAKAAAAARCTGEILVELDHDDELLPEAVATIRAAFADHPDVDFVFSDWIDHSDGADGEAAARYGHSWAFGFGAHAVERIDGERTPVALAPPLTWETVRHLVGMPNHVRAWRASFYREIGGHDAGLDIGDDYELLVRTFLAGVMARIPRPLYVQHYDPARASASKRRNAEIQTVVAETAARHERALDERCLALGAIPAAPDPLTSWEPLRSAARLVDPLSPSTDAAPLVSVLIPTYRRPDLLREAIASALSQTHTNIEVLVVGDGCPDMDEVVAGETDPHVRSWNLQRNHGLHDHGAAPRNYALKTMARGELIAYLDDDNLWRPDHLESLVAPLLADPGLGFAFSSYETLGEVITCRRPQRFQIDTSALVHRRGLLESHGYWRPDGDTGWAHDWELVARWEDETWAATLEPTLSYRMEDSPRGRAVLAEMREAAARTAPG